MVPDLILPDIVFVCLGTPEVEIINKHLQQEVIPE